MPFKSEAQRRYMHAKHPEIAKEWEEKEKDPSYKEAAKRRLKGKKRK